MKQLFVSSAIIVIVGFVSIFLLASNAHAAGKPVPRKPCVVMGQLPCAWGGTPARFYGGGQTFRWSK